MSIFKAKIIKMIEFISNLYFIRLISIFTVLVFIQFFQKSEYLVIFSSILFSHYFLSFYYSKYQMNNLVKEKQFWFSTLVLIIFSLIYIYSDSYLVLLVPFIGVHIALSETYMLNKWHLKTIEKSKLFQLNAARFLFNISIFFQLIFGVNESNDIAYVATNVFFILSLLFLFFVLKSFREKISKNNIYQIALFESVGLLFLVIVRAFGFPIKPQHFVFYHIITWLYYSFIECRVTKKSSDMKKLIILAIASTSFFYFVQKDFLIEEYRIDLSEHIPLWATLHFCSSFALSTFNPQIVRKFFYRT
jgi:hypothetical protein